MIYHSGRGGYRGGIKPKTPEHLKRETLSIRLPKWIITEIKQKAGTNSTGKYIEDMLIQHLDLKQPTK